MDTEGKVRQSKVAQRAGDIPDFKNAIQAIENQSSIYATIKIFVKNRFAFFNLFYKHSQKSNSRISILVASEM